MVWVVIFMIAPLGIMFIYSFWRYHQFNLYPDFSLANYRAFFNSPIYVKILGSTVLIASLTTLITVGLAYPLALLLYRQSRTIAFVVIALVTIPFWINTLVRNFAFYGVFGRMGLINAAVTALGFKPLEILFTLKAVVIVAVYIFLPYALIALYSSMEKISPSLLEAAQDLGANGWQSFRYVTFPLSWSGLQTAIFFVFVPTLGLFVTPAMIGGGRTPMMGTLVVPIISETLNFALGSAFAFILLAIVFLLVVFFRRALNLESLYSGGAGKASARRSETKATPWFVILTALVLLFLYIPVILVVIFSFDKNVAAGFPLRGFTLIWYRSFLQNPILLTALQNSVLIALMTAGVTMLVAAPAAYTVVRFRFVGRELFRTLILVPLIVPELLLAAGILMLMAKLNVPPSMITIVLGHITYALPFVFFVVLAQQYGFERSVEEAAHDLGANSWQKFYYITLPLMLPALLGGGLLAFTLSLNDFIITFLLTGATRTLPLYMWGLLMGSLTPELNAVSTILIGGVLVLVLTPMMIAISRRRSEKLAVQRAGRF